MDFWTIVGLGWIGMFMVAPFRKPIGSAILTSYNFCIEKYQVRPKYTLFESCIEANCRYASNNSQYY